MKHSRRLVLTLILLTFYSISFAQKLHYELPDNAAKLYSMGNYYKALELYRTLYKKDLTNNKHAYHYGVCLIYTHHYKDGLEILEKISAKSNTPKDIGLHLGRAYHFTLRFDKAKDNYTRFLKENESHNKKEQVKRWIEMCDNAETLVKNPINVSFENLGDKVNSPGKDFFPVITENESVLYFTTRREGTTGRVYDLEGYYTADIYMAKYKYDKWGKPRSIGAPNSYGNEQIAGVGENSDYLFYHVNNPKSKNNLQLAEKSRSSFKKSTKIDNKLINLNGAIQNGAAISGDGFTMVFSSDRIKEKGFDLYLCKKLPNNKWGKPELITELSTNYNDNYPYLSNNGTSLYFASEGFNSMGGYDLFISNFDTTSKKWSKPENLGYPINSPHDDYNICFTENKKYAYIAANRKDSYGNYDIYKINFENNSPPLTTIKGYVLNEDSTVIKSPTHIEVFNHKTGDLEGIYDSTIKGKYLMILPPGKYELIADVPNQGTFKEVFVVADRKNYKTEISKNIQLNFASEEFIDD